ncbi:MAG: peroxide stress protein YaaA [Ruminococcus sp.]|jgi:cytoplasmic iron level regulating protein YaaA (DUF328/UPF0246 family)
MKIIISPAKKMNRRQDYLQPRQLPACLEKAERLERYLKQLSYKELKAVLNCGDSIAREAYENYQKMDLRRQTLPAVLAYEGIQYQYMAPQIFEESCCVYIKNHLRILSGFYGILRPFDGVVPYRLEMQAKLKTPFCRNLYDFWDRAIYDILTENNEDLIVNLASAEYSKAVKPYRDEKIQWIDCTFGEWTEGKVREKGVYVKMARGEMVRYMAQNNIQNMEGLKNFHGLGYVFEERLSDKRHLVFLKNG